MSTTSAETSLFAAYPVQEYYELSSGTVCQVPYYCRNANMLLLHGLAELGAVGRLLQGQNYHPVAPPRRRPSPPCGSSSTETPRVVLTTRSS